MLNNLAWFYATCEDLSYRDSKRALVLAKRAEKLLQLPHILDTLAESYFVNGMYDLAVATELRALKLVKGNRIHYEKQLEKFKKAAGKES